ncbi:M48 family metallopeptidase [Gymnodinialimonas ceratoperidinii]|uniref:M48 family metallopeptidase n=1 Tax=Gymnodinialimonas ceratoperidinii TaxID=2856823 RepID=A0A8F6Y905_9RHOB|nr:M48 family metallopeptidase [Gymnodinialimonas ceratoperidinii]QXT38093.1 M48 family metallopeptidase [Gymnodinialimonas ceratoperidinii]
MLKLTPILLAVGYGLVMYLFSAWRTNRDLKARSTELADARLRAITEKFAKVLDVEKIRVNVYEVDAVNGLAAPNGQIYLTRGFYNRYLSGEVTAEELASVIAHELGHVAMGHTRRRMVDFSGQNAVRVVLASVLGRFIPGIGAAIANAVGALLAARLSRQDEYEADAYATSLMVSAGLGAGPQKTMFEKLERLAGLKGGGTPAWLMSHPKTSERIAAIEAMEARWRSEGPAN